MTTIVSVTPIAVERDSRTFKQAASLANLGYRSIVVEGERSTMSDAELPFELLRVEDAPPPWNPGTEDGPAPVLAQATAPDAVARPVSGGVRRQWRRAALGIAATRGRLRILRAQVDWNLRTYRSLPRARLYVLHGYMQFPAVLVKASRHRARIAYDAHDAYFLLRPGQERDNVPWQRLWAFVERGCVRLASGFATVSEGLADVLEERHRRRPVTIRNLHDLRLERPAGRTARSAAGLSPEDFLVVSIGNDKDGMAVDEALTALALLPSDVHMAWIGRGLERHAERARELGVEDRAHFVGAVTPTTIVDFVHDADAAMVLYWPITANYRNALPNGFFQSVGAGLPILYPRRLDEMRALAEEHELGFPIEPTDPVSIAEGVRALSKDPANTATIRGQVERARVTINWEHEESRLASYVRDMLKGGHP